MKQRNLRLTALFHKYMENDMTELEEAELWDYIDDPAYFTEIHQLLGEAFSRQTKTDSIPLDGRARVLEHILGAGHKDVKPRVWNSWTQGFAAAAAIAAIILSIWIFHRSQAVQSADPDMRYANDIAPGKQGATLTLSNGKKIRLRGIQTGELAKEGGAVISKSADGKLVYEIQASSKTPASPEGEKEASNILSTAKGETYFVILSDGTRVWLNSSSVLTFPVSFSKPGERTVQLNGEAYFEVTKNKTQPFHVISPIQTLEVLGTHFNVSSYMDEAVAKTTLVEGSVRVSALGKGDTRVISPGEQSVVQGSGIRVQTADINEALAWKNGEFMFIDRSLEDIMKSIARWYDVRIIYEDPQMRNLIFGGTISRFDKVSKVLNMLELTGNVHFKVEGRRITVMK